MPMAQLFCKDLKNPILNIDETDGAPDNTTRQRGGRHSFFIVMIRWSGIPIEYDIKFSHHCY